MRAPALLTPAPWVPEHVQNWARQAHADMLEKGQHDQAGLLGRLLTDERMARVWAELSTRCRPTPQCPGEDPLVLFLSHVLWLAGRPVSVVTRSELRATKKRYVEMAKALEQMAAELDQKGPLSPYPTDARTLQAAAEVCQGFADYGLIRDYLMVGKDHGDRNAHAFVVRLSLVFKQLFGSYLYNQMAVIASVVHGGAITGSRVRNWLRELITVRV
jgi:hypothetical protein